MTSAAKPRLAKDIAGALDWWREAGVDHDYADEAHGWLDPVEEAVAAELPPALQGMAQAEPETPAGLPGIAADRSGWPDALEKFSPWWLADPSLDTGGLGPRIPPRGAMGAQLMVLVPEPEAEDRETLLSGPQGRLLTSMLAAMGIAPEKAYIASALPRHTPMADWAGLAGAGMGAVLAHHVALAAPQRILVLGRNILPLLGHESAQDPATLRDFNHEGGCVAMMVASSLENLLLQPRRRKQLWRQWLDWTGNGT